jgi:hypothetical protein
VRNKYRCSTEDPVLHAASANHLSKYMLPSAVSESDCGAWRYRFSYLYTLLLVEVNLTPITMLVVFVLS